MKAWRSRDDPPVDFETWLRSTDDRGGREGIDTHGRAFGLEARRRARVRIH